MENTFITLHGNRAGRPYTINVSHIAYFVESYRNETPFTELHLSSGDKIHVSETPQEISSLVDMASLPIPVRHDYV